ncbi:MAG: zinc ribbon domain-containing protein [Nitrospirae bacterium]|nr:zinc ribbon domain-containing protein [Nitrospirota bacterium]
MPIYEYECIGCGERFEVMRKISEPQLSECRKCGGKLRRLIASTSFVLKGSGWYVTDYPSADRKKAVERKKTSETKKDVKSASQSATTDSKKEEAVKT